jgi:hypothetical protein
MLFDLGDQLIVGLGLHIGAAVAMDDLHGTPFVDGPRSYGTRCPTGHGITPPRSGVHHTVIVSHQVRSAISSDGGARTCPARRCCTVEVAEHVT